MSPDEVTRILKSLQEIRDLLLGTFDHRGMISKVEAHESWINKQKRTKEGFVNYVYKVIIMIILTYIAVRTGLR